MAGRLPLEGLLVLDVATWIAAPAAATILGDYGAEVIKIEQPGEGDPHRTRTGSPHIPQAEVNYRWHLDSRNKKSLALDLKNPEGRAALDRLIARADIFITNFPFPVRDRLRLGYDVVKTVNPRLIYASFTGFGEDGPDKNQPGFDSTAYFARSGLLDSIRYEGGPPSFSLPAQGDRASAMGLLSGILLALYERERSGMGRMVTSSLYANGIWSNGMLTQAGLVGASIGPRPPRERPRNPIANIFRTKDDRWVSVAAANEDKQWPSVCEAVGQPSLRNDPRFAESMTRRKNSAILTAIFDEIFAQHDAATWIARLNAARVPHSMIARSTDVAADAQAVAAKAVVPTAIPDMPQTIAAPFQVDGFEPRAATAAPDLGADTEAVLSAMGFSKDEVAKLRAAGAIA